jgi:hypothetical protein
MLKGSSPFVIATLVWGFPIAGVLAQSVVLNGFFDCQKATNGRSYCKKQGAPAEAQWVPVSEEFFLQYEAARNGGGVSTQPQTVVTQQSDSTVVNNNVLVINLTADAATLKGQIALLEKLLSEQQALQGASVDGSGAQQTLRAIRDRLSELKSTFHDKTLELSKYQTSVKPDDADLQISARRESEIQTKIPYYIPGTKETGEFWVEPVVNDDGSLQFRFNFVDVDSTSANKIRSTIVMNSDEIGKTKEAFLKSGDDSTKAHEKGVRRELNVRLVCFPDVDCPPEGQKFKGKASTEIQFEVHEDGSTNARIQRNKGEFEEAYNISIPSALLLQAYISHVLAVGTQEHEIGSTSTEKLKELFK